MADIPARVERELRAVLAIVGTVPTPHASMVKPHFIEMMKQFKDVKEEGTGDREDRLMLDWYVPGAKWRDPSCTLHFEYRGYGPVSRQIRFDDHEGIPDLGDIQQCISRTSDFKIDWFAETRVLGNEFHTMTMEVFVPGFAMKVNHTRLL